MKTIKAETSGAQDLAPLLHALNQRYRREWDRAERLRAELEDIRRSRAWRFLNWLRGWRRWLGRGSKANGVAPFRMQFLDDAPRAACGRVSIVIPFRDQVGLLKGLLRSLRLTSYRRFELVLVDNGSVGPRLCRLLKGLRKRRGVRIVHAPGAFNFARLCNEGARRARGDFLLFLNNDTQVIEPDWLGAMLRAAGDPGVGVVGATLLYPDRTLQHVGIFPRSDGAWSHDHRGFPGDHPGEQGELRRLRTVPAVTAACLLLRRELFESVGGFDETHAVTGNDVDLCLRIRRRGLLVAVTPHARLLHYESLSRGYAVDAFGAASSNEERHVPEQ